MAISGMSETPRPRRHQRLDGLELGRAENDMRMAGVPVAEAQRLIAETMPFLEQDEALGNNFIHRNGRPAFRQRMLRRDGEPQRVSVNNSSIANRESLIGRLTTARSTSHAAVKASTCVVVLSCTMISDADGVTRHNRSARGSR